MITGGKGFRRIDLIKHMLLAVGLMSLSACVRGPVTTNMKEPLTVSLQELTPEYKAGPVLYVLAHQDDELLALHKIYLDLKAGSDIHVVWITDGGKAANPARRQKESRSVMALFGVPDQNLHFLGYPDQKSNHVMREAYVQIKALDERHHFTQIVSPAYEGGNIDHDVAAFLAARLARESSRRPGHIEYPLYNRYKGRRVIGRFITYTEVPSYYLKTDERSYELNLKAMKMYRTQRLALMLMGFITDKKILLKRGVPYRQAPAYDYLKRPTDELCDYEKSLFHPAKFEDWQKTVGEFLDHQNSQALIAEPKT